jgi:hypothetical protein
MKTSCSCSTLVAFVAGAAVLASNASAVEPVRWAPDQVSSIVWSQQQKVSGSDAAASQGVPCVLVYADHAFVCDAYATVGSNTHQGAVYVFSKSGTTWVQTQKLTASDGAAFDGFGNSIAYDPSGGALVIGASNKKVGTHTQQGAAYTFSSLSGTWFQTQELQASDGAQSDAFGSSVAVTSSAVFVGAPGKNKSGQSGAGAAYVFQGAAGSRTQAQQLWGDAASAENFGTSLAVNGNTTFIGAPYYYDGANDVGAVFAFTLQSCTGGTQCWKQQQLIVPPSGVLPVDPDSLFGISLATSGTTLLVGAPYSSNGFIQRYRGAVDVFALSGGVWGYQQQLTASDAAANNLFGYGIAISGTVALIGAVPTASPGIVYSFEQSVGSWSQQQEFNASDGTNHDEFGLAISISGSTALIAAYAAEVGTNTDQGAGYFFTH